MANRILMVTPDDEDVEVEEADFESAKSSGLEPAFEMVDRDGNVNVVRKRHLADAEKSGMTAKPVWDALNTRTPDRNKVGAGEAAARGFANMASPLADESAGFARNPAGAAKAALGLFGVNMGDDRDVQEYQAVRNAYRERDDDAWDQQGFAYGTGGALGIGAGMGAGAVPITTALGRGTAAAAGKVTARMAPRAARMATGAMGGAATGALQAAGGGTDAQGQADLATGDVGGFAKQTAIGAGAGGAFGGLSDEAIALLKKSTPALRTMAERAAYRTTGGLKSDVNRLTASKTTPEEVGRALLDEGMIKVGTKRAGEGLESRLRARLGELRVKQDQFLTKLDAMVAEGVPFDTIRQKIQAEITDAQKTPGVAYKKYANALQSELDDLAGTLGVGMPKAAGPVDVTPRTRPTGGYDQMLLSGGKELPPDTVPPTSLSFMDALQTKRAYDKAGKYQSMTEAPAVEAARTTRKSIKDAIDDAIAASPVAGPEAKDAYKADRWRSKLLMDALAGLDEEVKRELTRKQMFGITDTIAGSGAAGAALQMGAGGPAAAAATLATVGAKKGAEKFGDATAARLFDGAAKIIEKQGFEEGMRTLTRLLGADAAAQIGKALGERQRMQGGKQ